MGRSSQVKRRAERAGRFQDSNASVGGAAPARGRPARGIALGKECPKSYKAVEPRSLHSIGPKTMGRDFNDLPREKARRALSEPALPKLRQRTVIRMRVLVLDDEWFVAALAVTILLEAGHEVVGPASSAQEAMELAVAGKPQLALLDVDLKGAGSGLDVAHLCSDLGIPAVFVSGSRVSPEERDGAAGSLSKPYLPNDLLQAVEYFRSDCHSIPPVSLELFSPHDLAHRGRPE
jgi:CheY-like chemotaxis protein